MAILYTTLTGGSKVFWYCEYLQDSSLKPPKHGLKEDWSEAEHCRGVPVLNGNGMVMSMLPSTIRMTLFLERRERCIEVEVDATQSTKNSFCYALVLLCHVLFIRFKLTLLPLLKCPL